MADGDTLLLTVEQAAKVCQMSRGLAYDLISRIERPRARLGRVIREDATGNLVLHASPGLPTEHQVRMTGGAA